MVHEPLTSRKRKEEVLETEVVSERKKLKCFDCSTRNILFKILHKNSKLQIDN